MKSKMTSYILVIISLTLVISGCSDNIDEINTDLTTQNSKGFVVENGFLKFESRETFGNSINKIINKSDSERNKWEKEIGFLSQQRIVDNIINEELKKDSINRTKFSNTDLSPKRNTGYNSEKFKRALSLVSESDFHSDAYYQALSKGVIKLIDKGTEDEYWDFSVFSSCYVSFINEDGLYAIADTLYQVTNNGIKAIEYSEKNWKDAVFKIKNSTENVKFRSPIQKINSPGVITSGWVSNNAWIFPKRIKIDVELSVQYLITSTLNYEFFHRVHSECQSKNLLGKWIYDKCGTVTINGSWEISVYASAQLYSGVYSFTGNDANNYYFSVNPSSGTLAYYESYFIVQPNSINFNYANGFPELQLDYQPHFTRLEWIATRPGLEARITSTN